jgi:hypothetical protein
MSNNDLDQLVPACSANTVAVRQYRRPAITPVVVGTERWLAMSETASASCSRRAFLRAGAATTATAASVGTSGCLWVMGIRQQRHRRRRQRQRASIPGGAPISFASQRHRITQQMADQTVTTRSQLISAVGQAGTTLWIPGSATIDMTGESRVEIANNVTIASSRNLRPNARGGLIKTTDQKNPGVFTTTNEQVGFRVTGVRLKGPRMDYFDPREHGRSEYDFAVTGFRAYGNSVIVDNCEVFGWTNAGFVPGTKSTPTRGWFHHNAMHHNQMEHLGYPMDLYNGEHLIEWNYFDYNRHSIAGFGRRNNGYEARFNVVGPHAISHAFDMHYLGENTGTTTNVAGKYVNVHHNVFGLTSHSAFSIQGYPRKYARFCRNWCAAPKGGADHGDPEGVVFFLDGADVRVKNNRYKTVQPGHQWLKQLSRQLAQRSPSVLPPQPAPSGLGLGLGIQSPPSLASSPESSTTAPHQSPTTAMPSSTPTASTQKRVDPITGTPLTPVGGER